MKCICSIIRKSNLRRTTKVSFYLNNFREPNTNVLPVETPAVLYPTGLIKPVQAATLNLRIGEVEKEEPQ
jgi:hypothetical protein